MKLNIPDMAIDDTMRAFHKKHCSNHDYMATAMAEYPAIWNDCKKVAQLVILESKEARPHKYVARRLIQRYHALASKQDVAQFWGKK